MAAYAGIDTFDTYSDGDLTGENGGSGFSGAWSGSTGYDVQGVTTFGGSSKAVDLDTANVEIDRTLSATIDSGDMYFAIRYDGADGSGASSVQLLDGTTFGMSVQLRDDGSPRRLIVASSVGITELLATAVSTTWYIVNVNFLSSTTFKVRFKAEGGSFSAFTGTLTYSNTVSNPGVVRLAHSNGIVDNFFWDEIGTTDPDAVVAEPAIFFGSNF